MGRHRAVRMFSTILVSGLVAVACGSSGDEAADPPSTLATDTSADATAPPSVPGGDAERAVCDAFTVAEISGLLGSDLGAGELGTTLVQFASAEVEAAYTATTCEWQPTVDGADLRVLFSTVDDFEGGAIVCTADGGLQDEPVSGLGDTATWSYSDPGQKGKLVACTDAAVVAVEIDNASEDGLLDRATSIARVVLGTG